jgi:membrane-bound serine protease (ClpP class)
MRKWMGLLGLWCLLFSSLSMAAEKALVLKINSAIEPATQDYIVRGIAEANKEHVAVIILQINTPGGLESAMRKINQAILASTVPVIAYVAPAGAKAASAGTFIVLASHYSAMAPGTNIGAASPVHVMGNSILQKNLTAHENKSANDASAYLRSLAQLRGKNTVWTEQATRSAISSSAEEAKKLNVIDAIANDYAQLLNQADGHAVTINGATQKLHTKNLQLEQVLTDWRYDFLAFITNPSIAYLLMLAAIYGLFFEFSNPGFVLPGVAGIICLLLALYAFQLMPINYAGLTLIMIGIAFMVFEVYLSSFGILGIGGVIAFIIGSIMLFDVHYAAYPLTLSLIIVMGIITASFFFLVLTLAIRSQKKSIVTGKEGLIGERGTVVSVMNKQIVVRVMGELWEAKSAAMLYPGQDVVVTEIHGLTLDVETIQSPIKQSGA